MLTTLLASLITLSGCHSEPPPPESLSAQAERGPFKLSIEITPTDVWIGQPFKINLRMRTPEGYAVEFPAADDFGDLEVHAADTPEPQPGEAGELVWRRSFNADSLASGDIEIPAITVRYGKTPASGSEFQAENELVTEPLKLVVRSALTSQDSIATPRDISETLLPPRPPLSPRAWAIIIGSALVGLLAVGGMLWWLVRLVNRPAPPIPAEVLALRDLNALSVREHFDRGLVREFYYRLSEIVRVYIERKFDLAAPEMTTEEFLDKLARDRSALPYDADRLRQFLESCDLVKYAALQPVAEDGEQSIGAARAFVDATAAAAAARKNTADTAAPPSSPPSMPPTAPTARLLDTSGDRDSASTNSQSSSGENAA